MKDIAREIRATVDEVYPLLARMTPEEVSRKARADKWCKKEILGHLIDSASNNHQRFVRASYNAAAEFPQYDQVEWVRIQRYAEAEWPVLVILWSAYNRHLSHVIERIPEAAWSAPCNMGGETPVPLASVIKDYLRHVRHHVQQILEKKP